MGVLPLRFRDGQNASTLGLDGRETYAITGLADGEAKTAQVTATRADGSRLAFEVDVLLLTPKEIEYARHGGLLQYVLRQLAGKPA
jgi:aconitate hydratase